MRSASPPGRDLEEVHRAVDADDDPDRRDTEALTYQIKRDRNPEQRIDEVLDVARLRGGEQRPVAVRRALQHLIEREVRVVMVVVTLGLCVLDGFLDQEDGDEERQHDDHGEEVERLRPQTPLTGDDTRDPSADGDASVAEGLVDADREAALFGPCESIFALIAMLQVNAWLIPSRTFPTVIQPQLRAKMRMTGSGSAVAHPATRTGLRPYSSPHLPA